MNCDDEELRATKSVRQAYDTVYTEMCKYMDLYNQAVDDIQENYYSKDKILKALGIEYLEQDLSEDRICSLIESLLKEKRRVEKELEEQAKSKVTEQELKDMIIGMLE